MLSFVKVVSRWISSYLLHFILIFSFFPLFVRRSPNYVAKIGVDPSAPKFSKAQDPIWVAQMTDLHVSPVYDVSLKRVNDTFSYIGKNVNPLFLLLTGDLTDNLDTSSVWSPAYPHEEHFKLYEKIRNNSGLPNDRIIEILGNHDTWGRIEFPDSYRKYFIRGFDNFYVQTYTKKNVRVISFAPIHFPTGHTTFHFIIPLYREELDALEDALDEPTNANITIFSMHFTTGMMFPLEMIRSTRTHRNLKEILSDPKYNVAGMLTGHTHPAEDCDWIHYGKTIELTATALLMRDGFAIFSVDNGRINYRMYDQNMEKLAILTSPGPNKLSTRIFNDEQFQIRVVALTPNAKDFTVSGDVKGTLTFQRDLDGGSKLYGLDVNLKPGNYTITISGDLNETCEFSVGVPVGPFYEEKLVDILGWVMVLYFVLVTAYQALIMLSLFLPESWFSSFDDLFDWLNDKSSESKFRNALFGGPISAGRFLKKLPLKLKYYSIFITVFPFIFPMALYSIEGKIGYITWWGVKYGNKQTYDACSSMFMLFFEGFTLNGLQNLLILTTFKPHWSMLFDLIYNGCLIASGVTHWHFYGDDRGMPYVLRITTLFHIIPFVSVIVFFYSWISKNIGNHNLKEKTE